MQDIILKIENISKEYKLGQIGGTTLREELQRAHAKLHHKEDPTQKIGKTKFVTGDKLLALDHVSFSVRKGERIGIIGHNGAGKTTLLKLICRITAPSDGDIWFNGRITSMLEVGTGFHGELTGRENIYMNGAILGMKKKEIDEKIESIIEFSECRQFIDTPVKRYSSGMYVKLAFSVASYLDSEIMIMDEVLAVGDMAFQKKCLDRMSDISREEGRTILYVSHNMNTIRQLCDRCIVLDHGRVIFDGDVGTGISLYLREKEDVQYPIFYDYTKVLRRHQFGKDILIESFRFLGCESTEYSVGSVIPFEIVLSSKIARENLCFVLRIKDNNGFQKVATCLSNYFSVDIKDHQTFRFVFESKGLMPDIYSFDFEVVQFNADGHYYSYDSPNAMMKVRIVPGEADQRWSLEYWGNIYLNNLRLSDVL